MDENLIKRELPYSASAEKAVISSMLMDDEARIYAMEHLTAGEFYNNVYGLYFDAISELSNEGKEVDSVTLQDRLKQKGAPPQYYETGYIAEIVADIPSSVMIKQHCNIIGDKAIARRLIKASEDIANKGYTGTGTVEDLLADAETQIYNITQGKNNDDIVPIRDVVLETLDIIQKASKSSGEVTGIPTGFVDLDHMTAGLHGSELILIAARPAMGKTAFVLNIAQYAAFRRDYRVAIFSLEMGREQLVNRLISMESKVNGQSLKTGNLSDEDWDKVVESAGIIGKSNLVIVDTPGITVRDVRSKCRRLKTEEGGLDLVIIDYLQLMSGGGRSESRQNEIAEISRSLKVLARELNVPVIALSQLSRAVEQRDDKRPMLSDLRESGAIEQDADIVMFIYRDDYYHKDSERPGVADVIIAKQRNGSTGDVQLLWMGEYMKFHSLERKRSE